MENTEKVFTIQDIRNAIEFGKNVKSDNAHIDDNYGSPYIDYHDTTIETEKYIMDLSLSKDCL